MLDLGDVRGKERNLDGEEEGRDRDEPAPGRTPDKACHRKEEQGVEDEGARDRDAVDVAELVGGLEGQRQRDYPMQRPQLTIGT